MAFSRFMAMRRCAQHYGFEVHCSCKFRYKKPMTDRTLQSALQSFSRDEIRSAMIWLTRGDPFMEDIKMHLQDQYLECEEEIVTDSSVGEVAIRTFNGIESGLISVTPSNWDCNPVVVKWRREDEGLNDEIIEIQNWCDADHLKDALPSLLPKAKSWTDLKEISKRHFPRITFSDNCFDQHLKGIPFYEPSAQKFVFQFGVLDRILQEHNDDGQLTQEGHRITRDFFHGDNALFSNSSPTERKKFERKLTFPHPTDSSKTLFCPWHGKVGAQSMRFHFSWPVLRDEPRLCVVYVGPKITKK